MLWLTLPAITQEIAPPSRVATISELQAIPHEQLSNGLPVLTKGLLTYLEPGHRMAFIQDDTGAMYIHTTRTYGVKPGDLVEVQGILDPGYGGRNIRGPDFDTSPQIRSVGTAAYPTPIRIHDLRDPLSAKGAVWSEIQATIDAVSSVGDRHLLTIRGFPELPVYLPMLENQKIAPNHLQGLTVMLRGIFADTPVKEKPLVMKRVFLIPDITQIHIPDEEKSKRFNAPLRGLSTLQWIPEKEGPETIVKIAGNVTWHLPHRGFFLQSENHAVWVECTEPILPEIGKSVVAVGRPISYHGSGVLAHAMWMPANTMTPTLVSPLIQSDQFSNKNHHAKLGTIHAHLVELIQSPLETMWIMKTAGKVIFVHLHSTVPKKTSLSAPGAELAMTGIILNQSTPPLDFRAADETIHVFLRNADDIMLLEAAPFWTFRRLYTLLISVAITTILIAVWVAMLRAKVSNQAAIIKTNVSNEIIQSERLRLARQWHDTFEQHFAGLTMQLDAVTSLVPHGSGAHRMLQDAANMADHSRKVARDAIWNLRAEHDVTGTSFITQLENTLKKAWPTEFGSRLVVEYETMDQVLTEGMSLTLIRIVQEAVTNSFKHSGADRMRVIWSAVGEAATLLIVDNGKGMTLESSKSFASRGHFGILGMKERVAHIGGTMIVHSPPPDMPSGTMIAVHVNLFPFTLESST